MGLSQSTVDSLRLFTIVGGAEIALALIVLVFPVPALLLFIGGWKILTELLRPLAGEPFWEFVERSSNMLAPLASLSLMRLRGDQGAAAAAPGDVLWRRGTATQAGGR